MIPAARAGDAIGWASVVVRIKGEWTLERRAEIGRLGGDVYRHLPLIESVAVRIPRRRLGHLARLPYVLRLSADVAVQKTDTFTVGASGADVVFAQNRLTGRGIGVAVVDSGVRAGGDLGDGQQSRLVAAMDFVGGGTSPDDTCGHGTHVAGIIAGNGSGSDGHDYFQTFYGIARAANLVSVRVLDGQGQGAVSNVVAGIQWAVGNKATYNIRVLNLSLGHAIGESYTTDPLCLAVEQAWKAGIVVVCAAGNAGRANPLRVPLLLGNEGYGTAYGSILSPGNSPYVITVGAMKRTTGSRGGDQIATYSSRGPTRLDFVLKPDLVAPGDRVASLNAPGAFLAETYGATNGVAWQEFDSAYDPADASKYFRLSGTSMAAPVVSGAAALLLQADPTLTPDTIKARLMLSADKWGFGDGTTDPCTFGAGYLNIPAALASTVIATQNARSPALFRGLLSGVFLRTEPLWATQGMWGTGVDGTHIMWGSGAGSDTKAMSSSGSLWGASVWVDTLVAPVADLGIDLSPVVIYGDS